jgi:hypothetical protein
MMMEDCRIRLGLWKVRISASSQEPVHRAIVQDRVRHALHKSPHGCSARSCVSKENYLMMLRAIGLD